MTDPYSRSGRSRPATIGDVARLAGVSTATVSRALADDSVLRDRVSDGTRRKVAAAAAQLDFRMNHAARSLKTRSSRTVAVLAPELSNDFFMELAEAMEKELAGSGYILVVCSSGGSVEEERRRLKILSSRLVDGVVVIPASDRGEHLRDLSGRGVPVVLVDRLVEGGGLDAVVADNEGGAREATIALAAEGHGRLAFVGGTLSLSSAAERLAGFRRGVAEASAAGLCPPLEEGDIHIGGMGVADGYALMDELLRERDAPKSIFAVNLLVHLGAERRLMAEGRRTLGSFAFASFDETPYSPFMESCRYAVAQPAAEMGAAAARLVLERIARGGDASEPRTLRLPTKLSRFAPDPSSLPSLQRGPAAYDTSPGGPEAADGGKTPPHLFS